MKKKTFYEYCNIAFVIESCILLMLGATDMAIWAMVFAIYHYEVALK